MSQTNILERALSHLRREISVIPEGDTRRPIIQAEIALLDEAATYWADWTRANSTARGATPSTLYRHEIELAHAIVARVERRMDEATAAA